MSSQTTNTHYVTMDPRDNSVVLSPELFARLGGFDNCHRAYVFKISGKEDAFAFILNPDFAEETQIADVQVNTSTKDVGFECLTPSVVMMFARWGFDLDTPRRVPVVGFRTDFDFGYLYAFDHKHSVCI